MKLQELLVGKLPITHPLSDFLKAEFKVFSSLVSFGGQPIRFGDSCVGICPDCILEAVSRAPHEPREHGSSCRRNLVVEELHEWVDREFEFLDAMAALCAALADGHRTPRDNRKANPMSLV